MTFKEIYDEKVKAGADFVAAIAERTCKTEGTVRQWLYGAQKPDALTKSVIADYLGATTEELFPEITNQNDNDNEKL